MDNPRAVTLSRNYATTVDDLWDAVTHDYHISRSRGSLARTSAGWKVRISDDGAGRVRLTLTNIVHVSEHWSLYGPGAVGVG